MTWETVNKAFQYPQIDLERKFKRCDKYILELKIVENETKTNEMRKGVVDNRFAKFRATCLLTIRIYDIAKELFVNTIDHKCGPYHLTYQVGEIVRPNAFNTDLEKICTSGIHYFNSLLAAYWFTIYKLKEDVEFTDNGQVRSVQQKSIVSNLQWLSTKFGLTNPKMMEL